MNDASQTKPPEKPPVTAVAELAETHVVAPMLPILCPGNMREALDLAQIMSSAKLVPTHLQGHPSDCLLVIEQSVRWGMSPFAVAQAASSIKGKLMYEGKLVAAAVNTSKALQGRLKYKLEGDGEGRAVIVSGLLRGEDEARTVRITLKESRTENSCWKNQPDQQLCYHGTRVWARRHVPEVMLGVYSPEEPWMEDNGEMVAIPQRPGQEASLKAEETDAERRTKVVAHIESLLKQGKPLKEVWETLMPDDRKAVGKSELERLKKEAASLAPKPATAPLPEGGSKEPPKDVAAPAQQPAQTAAGKPADDGWGEDAFSDVTGAKPGDRQPGEEG